MNHAGVQPTNKEQEADVPVSKQRHATKIKK
jgi:hypothetical protein